ncbi:PREDICTED: GDSL esterase/lipase 3-like [Ipomoea nil]|uniref:GDSL esterase/lipase 3-like n=1 Tax=Ipomoea nil TaxID=35883 RepID=UPI00090153D4|nr:PREDICTED: GDSL esterase/lipase 3-like [Ipomoea nil]
MFSIGNNDYLSPFETNSIIFNSYTKEEYVDMVIDSFINVIKEVYKEGGRKFVIFSAVPLACLPYSRALKFQQTNRTGCLKKFQVFTKIHNKILPKKLIELEKTLQGFKYSYFDFFQAATDIIDHPSRYGFKEAKTACCGSGPYRGLSSCGGKRGKLKEYELCKDVRDYMFFDNVHLIEKSNLHFATLLWNGDPNMVRSCSMKSLFHQVAYPQPEEVHLSM